MWYNRQSGYGRIYLARQIDWPYILLIWVASFAALLTRPLEPFTGKALNLRATVRCNGR